MDLNIHLHWGKIFTSLYAKPLALHLYIPPSSCSAPGLTRGLITGQLYRIYKLCSHKHDIEQEISSFFNHLLERRYSLKHLIPLFLNAEQKVNKRITSEDEKWLQNVPQDIRHTTDQSAFFHLTYHPNNPPTREIQTLWRTHVQSLPSKPSLAQLTNRDSAYIPI